MDFSVSNISLLAELAMKGGGPEEIGRKVADMHRREPRFRITLPVPEEGTWTARFATRAGWPSDWILRLCRFCERNDIPFHIGTYGPSGPKINLSTAQKILDAAPDCCEGFKIGEVYNGRTFVEADAPYARGKEKESFNFLKGLIELARQARKKVFWIEHCHDGPGYGR